MSKGVPGLGVKQFMECFYEIQDHPRLHVFLHSCLSCRGPIGSSPPWEWLDCNVLLLSYKHGKTIDELS